jgi:hypothetical protein
MTIVLEIFREIVNCERMVVAETQGACACSTEEQMKILLHYS